METTLSYDPKTLNIFNSKSNYLLEAQKEKNNRFMVGQSYGSSRDYILADNLYYFPKISDQEALTNIIFKSILNDKELAVYIWVVFKKLFLHGILKEIANLKICTDDFLNKLKKEDLIQEKGTTIIDGLKLYTELTEKNTKVGVTKIIKKGLFVFSVLFFAHSVNIISEYFTEEKKNEDFKPLTLIFDVGEKGSKINEYYDLLDKIIENKDKVENEAEGKTHSFELGKIIEDLRKNDGDASAVASAVTEDKKKNITIKGHTFSRDILERSIRFCYAKFFNTTTFITILNTRKKNDKELIIPFLFLLHLISDPLTKLKHIFPNLTINNIADQEFLELIDASESVYNLMISKYCVSKLEKYLEGFQLSIMSVGSVLGEKILSERNIEEIFGELRKGGSTSVGFIEEETGAEQEAEVGRQEAAADEAAAAEEEERKKKEEAAAGETAKQEIAKQEVEAAEEERKKKEESAAAAGTSPETSVGVGPENQLLTP